MREGGREGTWRWLRNGLGRFPIAGLFVTAVFLLEHTRWTPREADQFFFSRQLFYGFIRELCRCVCLYLYVRATNQVSAGLLKQISTTFGPPPSIHIFPPIPFWPLLYIWPPFSPLVQGGKISVFLLFCHVEKPEGPGNIFLFTV